MWLGLILRIFGRLGSHGGRCLGGAGFALRVSVPFQLFPPLSSVPLPLPSYSPSSIRGLALTAAVSDLLAKEAIELALTSPGFYSCLFVTPKVTDGWCPVIDLSRLKGFVDVSHFHMETTQTVLQSLREGDWLVSLDLQDSYLQVPVHPSSRWYLRFCVGELVYQFRSLCFGLSMAPQIFTRVMVPVSMIMHRHGFRILRYLDDWLVLASTVQEIVRARDFLLWLCQHLGIRVNLPKSSLVPKQTQDYLGITIQTYSFEGFPDPQADPEVVSSSPGLSVHPLSSSVLLETTVGSHVVDVSSGSRFQTSDACSSDPPQCGQSSPAGRFPSEVGFQLPSGSSVVVRCLSSSCQYVSRRVSPRPVLVYRRVGFRLGCLCRKIPSVTLVVSPVLSVFHQSPRAAGGFVRSSGIPSFSSWSCGGGVLRQHHRPSLPQETRGHSFVHFQHRGSVGSPVLRGVSHSSPSPVHSGQDECPRRFSKSPELGDLVRIDPVCLDFPSSSSPLAGHDRPLRHISQSPTSCLFYSDGRPSVGGHRRHAPELGRPPYVCLLSFRSPLLGPGESPVVLGLGAEAGGSVLATTSLGPGPSGAFGGGSLLPATKEGSSQTAPLPSFSPEPPRASADCLAYLQRSVRHSGFSSAVARQLTFCR